MISSHMIWVGLVLPMTAPNAIMALPAQKEQSISSGRSTRMRLRFSPHRTWGSGRGIR